MNEFPVVLVINCGSSSIKFSVLDASDCEVLMSGIADGINSENAFLSVNGGERIESLKEMLEELFTYTKLKNETYELKKERQNLTQILKETVFSYYDEWAERGIVPEFDLTDTPVWIMGNGQALRRIIQNIVKNGLDHGNKELKIQLKKKENRAKLVFKNRVEYPDRIDLQRVFERFYKADEARSKNSTGLGLSITKGFVLKMNGEISAQMKGDWFSIHISFPLI